MPLIDEVIIYWIGLSFLICGVVRALYSVYINLKYKQKVKQQSTAHLDELQDLFKLTKRLTDADKTRPSSVWSGTRKFRITRKVNEAKDIYSFYLVPFDGKPLPSFKPGQHLKFVLNIPGLPNPVRRCYSLSSSPRTDHYRVSIKKLSAPIGIPNASPGMSSSYFVDQLDAGDILNIEAPSGHFYLNTDLPRPVVLIAGGIGITPLLSMLYTICESEIKQEVWFFYGVRNMEEHAMQQHLARLAWKHKNIHMHVCYSKARPKDIKGEHFHHAERITVDLLNRILPPNDYEYYACGPGNMMEDITKELKTLGVPDSRINYERFGPSSIKKNKSSFANVISQQLEQTVTNIKVNFLRSNKVVNWTPKSGSILDLAEANGITIDSSCRSGNCGTCATRLKAGDITYVDDPSATTVKGSCLTCVAIPKTELEIDA